MIFFKPIFFWQIGRQTGNYFGRSYLEQWSCWSGSKTFTKHCTKVRRRRNLGISWKHFSLFFYRIQQPQDNVHEPNVLVAHTSLGIDVLHLYTGRPVTQIFLRNHAVYDDFTGDTHIDQIWARYAKEKEEKRRNRSADWKTCYLFSRNSIYVNLLQINFSSPKNYNLLFFRVGREALLHQERLLEPHSGHYAKCSAMFGSGKKGEVEEEEKGVRAMRGVFE